ncbi:MAG: ABC transporter ATP-binding protein, partial [Pseudomonadota bacterium]
MSEMAPMVIDVRGLTKSFGDKVAVNNVAIQVRRGEIVGFLGPNGSGKTTTIRMICGLLTADDGEGTCLGLDVRGQSAAIKNRVGYMTQRFSFYEDLSIRENLEFVARLYGLRPTKEHVDRTLSELGLTRRQRQLAGSLSGECMTQAASASLCFQPPDSEPASWRCRRVRPSS